MPPRWPRKPDRNDADYRRLDDRMNFAIHVGIFAATNSGLWFFRNLGSISELGTPGGVPGIIWITGSWATLLFAHAVFIFAIAQYTDSSSSSFAEGAGVGFKPSKPEQKSTKSAKR